LQRAATFTWKKSARATLDVYAKVAGAGRTGTARQRAKIAAGQGKP
jgi:hypothetical protein